MRLGATILSSALCMVVALGVAAPRAAALEILNVSYDPTRELYQDINKAFGDEWKEKTGEAIVIRQSHGGSGKQARSVIDGLEADVVTLALAYDVDMVAQKGQLMPADWQKRLPNNSCPYTSTIVFLVRKGNPKGIKDWDDLVKPGVSVITPNPKTSGGARWNYLAAWGYVLKKGGDDAQAQEFLAKLFKNVPVLDTGARGSTTTFVERGMGDVFISWENEALLACEKLAKGDLEIVVPSITMLAEPSVALVDKNVDKHGTREAAQAFLDFLYSPKGQEICAKHFYRPSDADVAKKYAQTFPEVKMFTIDEMFGGWVKAQKVHFDDGGTFDLIYQPKQP